MIGCLGLSQETLGYDNREGNDQAGIELMSKVKENI
jgi:hypothetical protein